jgi:hypothetical protein
MEEEDNTMDSFPHKDYWRAKGCENLCDEQQQCAICSKYAHVMDKMKRSNLKKLAEPAHINSPISQTPPERIKLTLQMQRLKCADLERQLNDMKVEINKSSIEVDHQLRKYINTIIGKTDA